jgi:LPPG:FO 2-phospho-L-lactate transferase
MLMMKAIRKELFKNKRKVVAVSPIIGNSAVSGPAGKYMEAAGLEVSAYGLAKFYADVCSNLVIDTKDRMQTKKIQSLNMNVYDTKIRMKDKKTEDALASFLLKQIRI